MTRAGRWGICVVVGAFAGAACAPDGGRGAVVGSLVVPDCGEGGASARWTCPEDVAPGECEAFDLGVDFFALDRLGDLALLRLQHDGRPFARTDALLIEIRDVDVVTGAPDGVVEVGPDRLVRAALNLAERCPGGTPSFEVRGRIRFTRFGIRKGATMSGHIEKLVVRDARSREPLGQLHGHFDFTVRRGPPHQRFVDNEP